MVQGCQVDSVKNYPFSSNAIPNAIVIRFTPMIIPSENPFHQPLSYLSPQFLFIGSSLPA